jgi:HEAT repeat protein
MPERGCVPRNGTSRSNIKICHDPQIHISRRSVVDHHFPVVCIWATRPLRRPRFSSRNLHNPAVRKTRRYLLAALLIAILAVAALLLLRPDPEPLYEGKPLTYWLRGFDPGSTPSAQENAREAVQQLGTNALPTLLRLLRTKDSQFKLELLQLANKQHLINIKWRTAWTGYNETVRAFRCLGPLSRPAVPQLIQIYRERLSNPSGRDELIIAQVFGAIGPAASDAVPQLIQAATDTNHPVIRLYAVGALAGIHTRPDLTLPACIKALHDPVDAVRAEAIAGLDAFGTNAQFAVPDLVKALADPAPAVRDNASSALKKIDPEAAAQAGVK